MKLSKKLLFKNKIMLDVLHGEKSIMSREELKVEK